MNNDEETVTIETFRSISYFDDQHEQKCLPPGRYRAHVNPMGGMDGFTEVTITGIVAESLRRDLRFWLIQGGEFKEIDPLTLLAEAAE